jgi:hypothetical protein
MPESTTAPPEAAAAEVKDQPTAKKERVYSFKFEPDPEFTETALFLKGSIRGKIWISDMTSVVMRSLLCDEVDKINDAVRIKEGMSINAYQTEITYWNLAFSTVRLGDAFFEGTTEEKIKKLRQMASPILMRLSMAYLEFSDHVDDLFKGKEALAIAKKS